MSFDPINLSVQPSSLAAPEGPYEGGSRLYISNPRVVELPEEGCITFRFKRGPVTVVEGVGENPGRASVDLTLLGICAVKAEQVSAEGSEEHEGNDRTENQIDRLFESLRGSDEEKTEEE